MNTHETGNVKKWQWEVGDTSNWANGYLELDQATNVRKYHVTRSDEQTHDHGLEFHKVQPGCKKRLMRRMMQDYVE
jgi:hypothetical protein